VTKCGPAPRLLAALIAVIGLIYPPVAAAAAPVVVDFSDVALPTDAAHTQITGGTPSGNFWNGSDNSGGFSSQGVVFPNVYTDFGGGYSGWTGWSCSNVNDTTTPGYGNQYAAITGAGVSGTGSPYAVGYQSLGSPLTLTLPQATSLSDMYLTNTTYAYLSMLYGDQFAKQFTASDWFLLSISGLDSNNQPTGTPISFYLARDGKIVNNWQRVDLSALGTNVRTLDFNLSSSDNGEFGMNTPSYFAVGELSYSGPLTWSGASPAWSNSANWGGTALVGSQAIAFSGSNQTTSVNDLPPGRQFSSMSFTSSAGAFTLSGSGICLAGNLTNSSTSTQTIDLAIELVSGGGAVETTAGNIAIAGNVSGSGGLTKSGPAALILSGTNDYAGPTVVAEGALDVLNSTALPDGTSLTIAAGGALIFDPSATDSQSFAVSPAAIAAVPEPGTIGLLAAGGVCFIASRFLRRRRAG
jgi:autotransporter-associated beta strand protein